MCVLLCRWVGCRSTTEGQRLEVVLTLNHPLNQLSFWTGGFCVVLAVEKAGKRCTSCAALLVMNVGEELKRELWQRTQTQITPDPFQTLAARLSHLQLHLVVLLHILPANLTPITRAQNSDCRAHTRDAPTRYTPMQAGERNHAQHALHCHCQQQDTALD